MTERRGAEHYGEERSETDVAKAERIVARGVEAAAVAGSRPGETRQGRPGQGEDRGAIAGGNAGDGEVDRGAVGDGHGGLCEQPVVSVAQGNAGVKAHE